MDQGRCVFIVLPSWCLAAHGMFWGFSSLVFICCGFSSAAELRYCYGYSLRGNQDPVPRPQGPYGAPGHKRLYVSPISYLQEMGFIQPPWPCLGSEKQVHSCLSGKERDVKTRKEQSRNSAGIRQCRPRHQVLLFLMHGKNTN